MGIQKFKDVTIGGHEFRIGLVSALIGDWIVHQMTSGGAGDADVFAKIQGHVLNVCSVLVDVNGEKIAKKIYADGKLLAPELELDSDLQLLHDIFNEAMGFNFTPFLLVMEARAKELKRQQEASATSL